MAWPPVTHQDVQDEISFVRALGAFGNGADGSMTISANTTLDRDLHCNDLTVNSGVSLNAAGYRIHVRGTLTVNSTGALHNDGGNASANGGGNWSNNGNNTRPMFRSGGGVNGTTSGTAGAHPDSIVNGAALGGNGGGAYQSDGTTLLSGGGYGTGPLTSTGGQRSGTHNNPITRLTGFSATVAGNGVSFHGIAPGGSGAGGAGPDGGGGGGGGGGGLIVNARTVINNGRISANGGNGGSRGYQAVNTNNNHGGGGGGGGWVFVNCLSYTGNQPQANGGAGGQGIGPSSLNGQAGGAGHASVWLMGALS